MKTLGIIGSWLALGLLALTIFLIVPMILAGSPTWWFLLFFIVVFIINFYQFSSNPEVAATWGIRQIRALTYPKALIRRKLERQRTQEHWAEETK
jgi:hypothetical protein